MRPVARPAAIVALGPRSLCQMATCPAAQFITQLGTFAGSTWNGCSASSEDLVKSIMLCALPMVVPSTNPVSSRHSGSVSAMSWPAVHTANAEIRFIALVPLGPSSSRTSKSGTVQDSSSGTDHCGPTGALVSVRAVTPSANASRP
jgi:hypothetical protein